MSSVCLKSCSVESPYVVVCPARHRAQALKLYHTRQRGEVLSRGRVYAYARAKEARPQARLLITLLLPAKIRGAQVPTFVL